MKYAAGLFIGCGIGMIGILLKWWDVSWFLAFSDLLIGAVLLLISAYREGK
jgi:hypothetical protein